MGLRRLHWITRVVLPFVLSVLIWPNNTFAQNFLFTYNGPDTIFVGANCAAAFNVPESSVSISSTINTQVNFNFDYNQAGFQLNDFFLGGSVVTMYVAASDNQGNSETFSFDVVFADNTPPVFDISSLPPDNYFYNDMNEPPANVLANDNCGAATISYTQTPPEDLCAGGIFYRTWIATDTSGNATTHTQTLFLNPDHTPPQFTNFPIEGSSTCESFDVNFSNWLVQNMNTIAATDAVSFKTNAPTAFTFACDTTLQITFTAIDACGNKDFAFANFQVTDNSAPIILNQPKDTTVYSGNIAPALRLNAGLEVKDCDPNLLESFQESSSQNTNSQSCAHYKYRIVRDWTITDLCQNVTSFQQIISVNDTAGYNNNSLALPILTSQNLEVCEGAPIVIEILNASNYSSSMMVQWLTPKGTIINDVPAYNIEAATNLDEGSYQAIVNDLGCSSDTSANIYISVKPRPTQPIAMTNSPVCVGEDIELTTSLVSDVQYIWQGENYVGNGQNVSIKNSTLDNQGIYTVQASIDGCLSEKSEGVQVEVKELPIAPEIDFESPICQTGILSMSITNETQVPGATYTWIYNPNDTIGQASFFTQYQTNELAKFISGQNQFIAVVEHHGCHNISTPITIQIDKVPVNIADAGIDFDACFNQPISLTGQVPTIGSGFWAQTCGPSVAISNPDAGVTTVTNVLPNNEYCFVWSLSFDGCKDYSQDTVVVSVFDEEDAFAGSFIDTCTAEVVQLQAKTPSYTIGIWSQPQAQENTGIKIVEKNNPLSTVSGLKPGNLYNFIWTLKDVGCGVRSDSVQIRIAQSRPNAGADKNLCSLDSCIQLHALGLGDFDEGSWRSIDGAIDLIPNGSSNASACGLTTGQNEFVWTLNNGQCGDWARDTVSINFEPAPLAVSDTFVLDYGLPVSVQVTDNDSIYSDYDVEILQTPYHCSILDLEKGGKMKIQPHQDFIGEDQFVYRICNDKCDACTETKVLLRIGEYANCKVPTIFTPDQDGINDYLVIPCLFAQAYQNTTMSIMNRWGDEVYHSDNYQNDWDGTYHGKALREGTYFFMFDLGDGSPIQKGFVEITY